MKLRHLLLAFCVVVTALVAVNAPASAQETPSATMSTTARQCSAHDLKFHADAAGNFEFFNGTDCSSLIAVGSYDKFVQTLDVVFPQSLFGDWYGSIGPNSTVTGRVKTACSAQIDGIVGNDLPLTLEGPYFSPNRTLIGAYHYLRDCPTTAPPTTTTTPPAPPTPVDTPPAPPTTGIIPPTSVGSPPPPPAPPVTEYPCPENPNRIVPDISLCEAPPRSSKG